MRYLMKQLRDLWNTDLGHFEYGICFDIQEAAWFGKSTIRPNKRGIRLLAVWEKFIVTPIMLVRQYFCKHENMEDESYGGPDSGCMAGTCHDCGYSYRHRLY